MNTRPEVYFKFGIPILSRELQLYKFNKKPNDLGFLPRELKSGGMSPSISINRLNNFKYTLIPTSSKANEKFSFGRNRRYSPMSHGYIHLDKVRGELTMKGYLKWWIIPFLLFWFGFVFFVPPTTTLMFGPFGVLIFSLIFLSEREQYLKVWQGIERYVSGEYDTSMLEMKFSEI